MNNQGTIIYNLLCKLEEKYLTSERIRQAILEKDTAMQEQIEFIDSLFRAVITSLNFEDYRRAVKYLNLIEMFCKKFF